MMNRYMKIFMVLLLGLFIMGCSIGKGGLTTGVDGCTSLQVEEGQISVPTVFSANGKGLSWHKINEQCKDIPYHHRDTNEEKISMGVGIPQQQNFYLEDMQRDKYFYVLTERKYFDNTLPVYFDVICIASQANNWLTLIRASS